MSDHNLDFKELIIFIRELYTIIHHYCRAPCITGCSPIVKINFYHELSERLD
jgi:nucleosome binding factor SPN SPT16 subunit